MPAGDLPPAFEEETRFVWVDEDGGEVSPRHERLRSALKFADGWHEKWERLNSRQWPAMERETEKLTKTGKPPVKLQRLIVRIHRADLTEDQEALVKTFLEDAD